MYPIDEQAERLLHRTHGVAARLLASVNGSDFLLPLDMREDSGTVEVDAGSPMRRKLKATVVASIDDARVDPLAAEVRAEYAIVDPASGRRYWTPVGTFVITDAEEVEPGLVSIAGADRWQRVLDARFERPRTTSGNTLDTIEALLRDADPERIPALDRTRMPATGYTHRASLWDRDRDKAIIELAESIGAVVYFDALGTPHVEPVTPLGGDPVWTIGPGEGGVKVSASRKVSRSSTYNSVSVTGEPGGNTPPVYGVARDTAATSPTRWGGPFGKRTRFYSSSKITTAQQAQAVARAQLDRVRGVASIADIVTVQHPGLDAHDVIYAHTGSVFERLRVQSFTLGLGLTTTTVTASRGELEDDEGQ